ncbi:MAG: TraR/DksA family transcriptional regulator [Spirochaetaceae bacterium]|jgi:RNA polymerase-binding protein DksA|nr:TraR/DksA family transcriptional regulator [Spirochaetaceae bacterium]
MDKKFLEKMEKILLAQKKEIVLSLLADKEEFKEIASGIENPKDPVDNASDDIDRNMLEVLGSVELKRLKAIDSAISRIKQGKYGSCIKCGQSIPKDRLEAIPSALMCIDCKSAEERRNR